MKDTMIGVDLAKNVSVLHAATMTGDVRYRKKLSRGQFLRCCQVNWLAVAYVLGWA